MLLAGDIGGTKTNLAVYSLESGLRSPLAEATFPSRRYDSLEALVQDFLEHTRLPIKQATFGVAGPVVKGRAEVTNLPWLLDEKNLAKALDLSSVRLLNDLAAIANAVPFLETEDLHTLYAGEPVAHAPRAVIAPGTGLGEAFLTWNGTRYVGHASEGGHGTFGPSNDLEIELVRFLLDRFDHVSYERVCSGLGIPNIYAFFKETGRYEEPGWLAEKLADVSDPTPLIIQAALDEQKACQICDQTLETFISILGSEAGNLALKVLATGGVYLGGGIPPRIVSALSQPAFLRAFRNKGRLADLLEKVPVHIILNPKSALLGAASYGLAQLKEAEA